MISKMTTLEELRLSVASLENLDILKPLTNLKKLTLDDSEKLVSLKGIEALTKLEYLSLTGCDNIENIDLVVSFKKLFDS